MRDQDGKAGRGAGCRGHPRARRRDGGVRNRPEAVLGDFATPDTLVSFGLDDVAFRYGSRRKRRYLIRRGDGYYVFAAQWDIRNEESCRYLPQPGGDWWADFYPADPVQRPTGPLGDGCHPVNYDVAAKTVGGPSRREGRGRGDGLLFAAAALVVVLLVQQTAKRGARLVYEQGVGVIPGPVAPPPPAGERAPPPR